MRILIKNALVKSISRKDFVGDVLTDNGKIIDIGTNISADENTRVIDAEGYLLTPGLVDGHCHTGLLEECIGYEGDDANEMTDPVTPHLRAIDGINPMTVEFREALEGGVTTGMIGPGSSNVIAGEVAIIKTAGKCIDKMIVKQPAAMKIALGENPKSVYGKEGKAPYTRMGIAAILRETLFKAREYKEKKEKGIEQAFDMKMESMIPVISGEIPLKAHAHRADDIFTAIRVAKEFGVKLTLDHCTEGHLIADELAETDYPIFLGPTLGPKVKYELKNTSFSTAKVLNDRGIRFSIVTDAYIIPLRHLALCAALAVGADLPEDVAWRSITLTPAEMIGIPEKIGSIDVGKDADLVLFTGNPLRNTDAKAVLTMIDGEPVYSDGTLWERI